MRNLFGFRPNANQAHFNPFLQYQAAAAAKVVSPAKGKDTESYTFSGPFSWRGDEEPTNFLNASFLV